MPHFMLPRGAGRGRRGVLWTAFALMLLGACGRGDQASRTVAAGLQDSLPLPSERLIQLAADAEARLDTGSRVRSGARPCGTLGGTPSLACELELTVRFDTDSFPMDRIPGGFVVLAIVRNLGDSTDAYTGIPGGVTAYTLIAQGGPQRTSAWYYHIDQAQRRAIAIRRMTYRACPQPHADAGQVRAAFRACPATAGVLADTTRAPEPTWWECSAGCCDIEQ